MKKPTPVPPPPPTPTAEDFRKAQIKLVLDRMKADEILYHFLTRPVSK